MQNHKSETVVGIFVLSAVGVFLYMAYHMGALRFDRKNYSYYYICLEDVSGVCKKDDVKIAGVKVGWIDDLTLDTEKPCVKVSLMITKDCALHEDATASVRQEDLLGNKYVELLPGSREKALLLPGGELQRGVEGPSVDGMLGDARVITTQIQDLLARNQETLTILVKDLSKLVEHLNEQVPSLANELKEVTQKFSATVIPNVCGHVDSVAERCTAATDAIATVMKKINDGQGTLGKLVNDSCVFNDAKSTFDSVNTMICGVKNMTYMVDPHFESMLSPFEGLNFKDFKAYFDFRIYPTPNYFLLIGPEYRQSGDVLRDDLFRDFIDPCCPDTKDTCSIENEHSFDGVRRDVKRVYDRWLWTLQFGKDYKHGAFRIGLFESTAGVGMDFYCNFTDRIRLISTFEAYDFRGRLRVNDPSPHLKLWSRLFLTKNVYFVFGYDDFISKRNKSAFLGAGVRFDYDDFDYFLNQIGW